MSRRKKRPLRPRTLRMNRAGRLASARHWLATQTGRTPVQIAKSYRKRYGVDWPCAIQELALLGVCLDAAWVAQLNRSLEGDHRARRQKAEERAGRGDTGESDSDEYFAYIAGYTSGGTPFGLTWEEWRRIELEEKGQQARSGVECPF